jgi:hypothetical protein
MAHLWTRAEREQRRRGAGSRLLIAAVAVVAAVSGALVATGVSGASIPDSGGVIHGCYKTSGSAHALKVIDNSKTSCPKGSTALNWDQSPPGLGVGTGGAAAGTSGDTCVMGRIALYAGNAYPPGEAAADGQSESISMNTALFELLGTTYGGDGLSTFDLPDMQSLAPDGMTYTICVFGLFP